MHRLQLPKDTMQCRSNYALPKGLVNPACRVGLIACWTSSFLVSDGSKREVSEELDFQKSYIAECFLAQSIEHTINGLH